MKNIILGNKTSNKYDKSFVVNCDNGEKWDGIKYRQTKYKFYFSLRDQSIIVSTVD